MLFVRFNNIRNRPETNGFVNDYFVLFSMCIIAMTSTNTNIMLTVDRREFLVKTLTAGKSRHRQIGRAIIMSAATRKIRIKTLWKDDTGQNYVLPINIAAKYCSTGLFEKPWTDVNGFRVGSRDSGRITRRVVARRDLAVSRVNKNKKWFTNIVVRRTFRVATTRLDVKNTILAGIAGLTSRTSVGKRAEDGHFNLQEFLDLRGPKNEIEHGASSAFSDETTARSATDSKRTMWVHTKTDISSRRVSHVEQWRPILR